MLPLILRLLSLGKSGYFRLSLHHQQFLTEHFRVLLGSVQIAPGVGGVTLSQGAEAVPEINGITLSLGLRGNRHFRALGSNRTLELLTHGLSLSLLRSGVTDLFIGDRVGAVLAEELTGVISEHVGVGQDGLVSFVLIRQFLKQIDGFDQLIVGGDQSVFELASIVVKDRRNIRTEIINNFKTCFAYPVCSELLGADFQRSLGRAVGVGLAVVDPRHRGRHPRVAVLGSLLGSVTGRVYRLSHC